jgi:hypothetical protein
MGYYNRLTVVLDVVQCLRFITQHVEKWVCFHLQLEVGERKLFLIGLTDKGPISTKGPSFPVIVL